MSTLKRWTGLAWETIDNGAKVVGGLGGTLISEQVLTSNQSSVTFSNLNSLVDGDYTLEIIAKSANTTASSLSCYINNDSTNGRYDGEYIAGGYNGSTHSTGAGTLLGAGAVVGYLASNASTNGCIATVKLKRISGKTLYTTHLYDERGTAKYVELFGGSYNQDVSITSLVISAGSGLIASGSTFRLYGSKLASNIISYDPINHTNFVADRLLKAGEVAYINYTSSTSVPLRIQTEEGLYEMDIMGDQSITIGTLGYVTLAPNNGSPSIAAGGIDCANIVQSLVSNADSSTAPSGDTQGTTRTNFMLAYAIAVKVSAKLSTMTKSKVVECNDIRRDSATQFYVERTFQNWLDTTTNWTSLGTITFPFAQSGKIVVRRII